MTTTPHWPIPLGFKPIDLGLERIRALLDRLGNPERKLPPIIHVAGTNGKGSTIAFMRAMLEAAGYKVHVYTSPHLVRFNERIVLAGKEIEGGFLYEVLETCRQASNGIQVTFFEGTTAAAFLAFSQVEADILLLETGLGDRLDATNVITHPSLTVITPISYDHTEFLGHSLKAIAGEKAGIMKLGVACVVSKQPPEAKHVFAEKAQQLHIPLFLQDRDWHIAASPDGFTYNTMALPSPSLLGTHQYINAGAAITAVTHLPGFTVTAQHIAYGLAHAKHPARLQKLDHIPLPGDWEVWLDGGHNPAGGEALANVAGSWRDKPLYLISAMLKDKDCRGFFTPFKGKVEKVVCVPIPHETKSADPIVLGRCAESAGIPATHAQGVTQAIQHIISSERRPARILICGSLYLAGSVVGGEGFEPPTKAL